MKRLMMLLSVVLACILHEREAIRAICICDGETCGGQVSPANRTGGVNPAAPRQAGRCGPSGGYCTRARAISGLVAGLAFGDTGIVGDGGDTDSATFTFDAGGKSRQLLTADGTTIKPDQVKALYGKEFKILCDGVDVCSVQYAWKKGFGGDDPLLQPRYMDLSDWNNAWVEPGFVGIDPKLGRFKFAKQHKLENGREIKFIKRVLMGNLYGQAMAVRDGYVYTVLDEETRGIQVVDARDPKNLKYAGYCPLSCFGGSIVLVDNYAYVKKSPILSVVDISDPHNLEIVKSIPTTSGGYIAHSGERLYIDGAGGIIIYDITDRDDPIPLKICPVGPVVASPVVMDGHIYVLESKDNKYVIKIWKEMNPDDFQEAGRLEIDSHLGNSPRYVQRMVVSGDYLYLTDTKSLKIINIKDKSKPLLVSEYPEWKKVGEGERGMGDLVKKGDLLYMAAGKSQPAPWIGAFKHFPPLSLLKDEDIPKREHIGGVWVLNVKDPQNVQLVSRIDDLKVGFDALSHIVIEGDRLYAMSWEWGVVVFDISDPVNIKEHGNISLVGEVEYARQIGEKVYAAGNCTYVVDPYPAEEAHIEGYCWMDMHMFGKHIIGKPDSNYVFYQGCSPNRIVDVSNPALPRIAEYFTIGISWGEWIGDYLYAVKGEQGEDRVDYNMISTWKIPVKEAVERQKTEIQKGVVIYDMKDPRDPKAISQFETKVGLTGITVRGNLAYAVHCKYLSKRAYLYIFDISDVNNPKLLSSWDGLGDGQSMYSGKIYLKDNYLFLPATNIDFINWSDGEAGLEVMGGRVIDVSDPLNPKQIMNIEYVPEDIHADICDGAQSFYIRGNRLYVADYCNGLHVFDVTDIRRPKHLTRVTDEKWPWSCFTSATSVAGYGRYIYKTNFGAVDILEVPSPSDVPEGKLTATCALK